MELLSLRFQFVRTVAAVVQVGITLLILLRVYGIL